MKQLLLLLVSTLFLLSCKQAQQEQQGEVTVPIDLPQIKEKGELNAVTLYSSTSYFKYKMQPMGYEYNSPEGQWGYKVSPGPDVFQYVHTSPYRLSRLLLF